MTELEVFHAALKRNEGYYRHLTRTDYEGGSATLYFADMEFEFDRDGKLVDVINQSF